VPVPKRFAIPLFVPLLAAGLAAEEPQSTVRESVEVSVVEVPVNVVGRDGKPIAGLNASDFEIQDDGTRQAILSFDVIDLHRNQETTGPAEPTPAAGRRHFLLLFDLSFSKPNQIVHAREAAIRFIETAMEPDDLAAVATTSVEHGARLLVTFSSDRRQLIAAIHALGLPRANESTNDPLRFTFVAPNDPLRVRGPSTEATFGKLIDPTLARIYTVMAQKGEDQYTLNLVQQHLTEMDSLALALDTVEGRKTIIFFSEGFDSRLLLGSLVHERSPEDTRAENDALIAGQLPLVDIERRSANFPLKRRMDETLGLLRRSDCTVYPIDLSGLKVQGDANLGPDVHGEDALFAFANGTGGEMLRNSNDFEAQMRRITERTSLTYVLTFRPTKRSGEGAFHALKVRAKVKGAQVSARAGYYETRLFRSLNPFERSLSAADIITHEKNVSDFPMEVLALGVKDGPLPRVPVVLEIPGGELLRGVSGQSLRLGIYVYAINASGEVADFFARSVALDLTKERTRLRSGVFRYCGSLRLLPGAYRVRALVRDEDQGHFSFRTVSLDVPEIGTAATRALPPLFLERDAPGVSVSEPAGKESTPAAGFFELAGEGFVPRLRPELAPGKMERLCLMVYPLAVGAGDRFELEVRIRDGQGQVFVPAPFVIVRRSSPDSSGLIKLLVEFTPLALPPGDYSLSVTVLDPTGSSPPAQTEAPFRML
jgi:VWFA-related protein